MKIIIILVVIGVLAAGYLVLKDKKIVEEKLNLTSLAFGHLGNIPVKYTCDGVKVNPPLEISGVSSEARSLVLIMEDPDVPKNLRPDGMWDHWLKFNLPPTLASIEEGQDPGSLSGINTSKNLNYAPPCPPNREHRYFFYLYSLNTMLDLKEGATKAELKAAMQGHILQETVLVGLYERR